MACCEQHDVMFSIDCGWCGATHLLPESNIESKHLTSQGIVGYVKCPAGHLMVHLFRDSYPSPPPPAIVVAIQQRRSG